ncbi:hypothetical protein HPB47_005780 [Ixodes persulcatus]|uniref:Uncharacterized protein n=1 Tax=Ixodes persulcatus TaxID=34615 RepID=A0AC60PCZ2_IXOPE|nr:hypothetical protein HPB47_005780 [Ixodes persulcatus]
MWWHWSSYQRKTLNRRASPAAGSRAGQRDPARRAAASSRIPSNGTPPPQRRGLPDPRSNFSLPEVVNIPERTPTRLLHDCSRRSSRRSKTTNKKVPEPYNFFTSVPLLRELKAVDIWAVGTLRANRLQGCALKSEEEMRQEGLGSLNAKVAGEGDVIIVRWQDNGIVNVASTFVGIGEATTVRQWSEFTKKHVEITCPALIKEYNAFMGGVDKMDFLVSLYPLSSRTKKWTVRVISHFASLTLVNSWQEYLKDAQENHIQPRKVLDMLGFQKNVGLALILCNKPSSKKRGRPSLDQAADPPKKVHYAEPRPVNAVRYDGLNHWPAHATQKFAQRCKLEGCTSRTRIRCRKCKVFLCLSATNDCFYAFHHK